jgi:hypothetical protein
MLLLQRVIVATEMTVVLREIEAVVLNVAATEAEKEVANVLNANANLAHLVKACNVTVLK